MLVHCEKASETFQNIAGWNVVKNTLKTIIFRYNSNRIQITFVATKMSNLLCHHRSASPKCMSWSVLYEWQAWGQIYSKMYINTLHRVSAYTYSACSNMYAWSVCTVCAFVNLGLHTDSQHEPLQTWDTKRFDVFVNRLILLAIWLRVKWEDEYHSLICL